MHLLQNPLIVGDWSLQPAPGCVQHWEAQLHDIIRAMLACKASLVTSRLSREQMQSAARLLTAIDCQVQALDQSMSASMNQGASADQIDGQITRLSSMCDELVARIASDARPTALPA